jgi:hypothetical protein
VFPPFEWVFPGFLISRLSIVCPWVALGMCGIIFSGFFVVQLELSRFACASSTLCCRIALVLGCLHLEKMIKMKNAILKAPKMRN